MLQKRLKTLPPSLQRRKREAHRFPPPPVREPTRITAAGLPGVLRAEHPVQQDPGWPARPAWSCSWRRHRRTTQAPGLARPCRPQARRTWLTVSVASARMP